jgi:hypothetical protein
MPLSPWIAGACIATSRTDGFAAPGCTGTSVREKAVSSAEALSVVFLVYAMARSAATRSGTDLAWLVCLLERSVAKDGRDTQQPDAWVVGGHENGKGILEARLAFALQLANPGILCIYEHVLTSWPGSQSSQTGITGFDISEIYA